MDLRRTLQYIEREVQRRPDFIPHASSLFEISGDDVYYAALNRFDVVLNTNEIFEIKRQLDLDKAATAALVFDGDLDEKSWAAIENIAEQLLTLGDSRFQEMKTPPGPV